MKLYRRADAPTSDRDEIFRHPPTYLMMIMIMLVIVGIMLVTRGAGLMGYFFTGLIAAVILFLRPMLRARKRSSNWVARLSDDGLFVHLRSYLNFHFPEDTETVVLVPYSEIKQARVITQNWKSRDSEGVNRESRDVVELQLVKGDVGLENALQRERTMTSPKEARWFGSSSIRFREFPVRINDNVLRIEWTATPGVSSFVEALGARGVQTAEPITQDLSREFVEDMEKKAGVTQPIRREP